MNGFSVLLQKEWRENTTEFQNVMDSARLYYIWYIGACNESLFPEIMKSVGNMPEGPNFYGRNSKGKIFSCHYLGNTRFIGILIIVLAFMGTISGERKNGTATLLYVRPMSFRNYFLSKWIVVNAIVLGSVWLGFMAGWYYIEFFLIM